MTCTVAASTVADIILEAFSQRGLRRVEDASPSADDGVRFDLEGYRLHLVLDAASPQMLVLQLSDALYVDASSHPAALARTFELANFLHAHIAHVRFLIGAERGAISGRVAGGSAGEGGAGVARPGAPPQAVPEADDLARASPVAEDDGERQLGALISVSFAAPLFEGRAEHLVETFDLGVDALLYAAGRMHDELREVDVEVFETRRRRGLGNDR